MVTHGQGIDSLKIEINVNVWIKLTFLNFGLEYAAEV